MNMPANGQRDTLRVLYTTLFAALVTCVAAFAPAPSRAADTPPIISSRDRFTPVIAADGMVVGPERIAVEVGRDILREGGNAVDAAVATGFALAVTFPRAGNIGGGGFMLIHLANEDRQIMLDYREKAPAAANRDMYLDEKGELDRQLEYFSHQSAGVPGTVAGLVHAQKSWGTLPLQRVLAPAVALAADGIEVSYSLNDTIRSRAERLRHNEAARRIFLPQDAPPPVGSRWRQPDLAKTLGRIAKHGAAGFYEGKTAELIARDMADHGGLITEADLADYHVVEREPVRGTYRNFGIVSAPPPSSGGVHVVQMLNILEGIDLNSMGHNSADYLHFLTEAMKLAYADRSRYLGDPDFVTVPVAALTSREYADRLRRGIDPDRARPATEIAPGQQIPAESRDTTHFSVADRYGNVVSNTYTINFSFGSHIVAEGTGMLLNNEMADFAAVPGTANAFGLVQGEANRIQGGKRPLSSMTPTLVFRDGEPWLATGSPGGSNIITAVLQLLLNTMEFDMNVAEAAAAPRIHHQWQPDVLAYERGISPDTLRLLSQRGHNLKRSEWSLGRTQSIMLQDGWFYGASDPRRFGGWVAGYSRREGGE